MKNFLKVIFFLIFFIGPIIFAVDADARDVNNIQQGKRPINSSDVYKIKNILHPQIAPDASRALFTIQTANPKDDSYKYDIYLVDVKTGKVNSLTKGAGNNLCGRWSGDGKRIAFISDRLGSPQIWIMDADGANPVEMTKLDYLIIGPPVWSNSSKKIAFLGRSKDSADAGKMSLFILDVDSKTAQLVLEDAVDMPAWSPDDSQMAFVSGRESKDGRRTDLYKINLETNEISRLTDSAGRIFKPSWSMDGKFIAYLYETDDLMPWINICVVECDSKAQKNITDSLADVAGPRISDIIWSSDGKAIYFVKEDKGTRDLAYIKLDDGKINSISEEKRSVSALSKSADGKYFCALISDPTHPKDIWIFNGSDFKSAQLTDINKEYLDRVLTSQPEEVTYQTFDGLQIKGWVIKPVDFDMMKTYPLILYINDRKYSVGNSFWLDCQILAGKGYGVFYLDPRGSYGYGKDFMIKDYGGGIYQDIMMGFNAVINMGFTQKYNLGICGMGSGATMANWIITHNEIFKAAVSMSGVWDYLALYNSSSNNRQEYLRDYFNGYSWQASDLYLKYSPMAYAGNIKAPTLIMYDEADNLIPKSQSEEFLDTLKRLNVNSGLVIYKEGREFICGENTGLPKDRVDRINRVVAWFDKYLKKNRE